MIYLKSFERYDDWPDYSKELHWAFEDNYLRVHKILKGKNKGKIRFKIFNEEKNNFDDKYSMMFGAAILLDTKYANLPEIRKITIGRGLFRKVATNTSDSIFRLFISQNGSIEYIEPDLLSRISVLTGKLKDIPISANDLGDIFDKLRKFREEINEEIYKWEMEQNIKKYNL